MASNDNNKNKSRPQTGKSGMKTAWYLTPDSDKIQKIQLPEDLELEYVKPLLHCDMVEYHGFTNKLGKQYGVLMDEEGAFKPQRKNDCARRLLKKIPLRWGAFTGYYIVYAYETTDEDEDEKTRDMDLTPKEFVEQFTEAINSA